MAVNGMRLVRRIGFGRRAKAEEAKETSGEAGKGDDESASWVPVLNVYNEVQARLTMARLNDEGIPTRFYREAANTAIPVNVGILGLITILVPETMLEKAQIIVNDLIENDDDNDEIDDD